MHTTDVSTIRCVSPDTKTLTDKGWQIISDHTDTLVNVWNGVSFSKVKIYKTGSDRRTFKLSTDSYEDLWSTLNHKYFVHRGEEICRVNLYDLQVGDELLQLSLPKPIDGKYPLHHLEHKVDSFLHDLSFIPDNYHKLSSKLEWLSKFLRYTEFHLIDQSYIQILHTTEKLQVLLELKNFLNLLGCHAKIVSDVDLALYFDIDSMDTDLTSPSIYHLLISKKELIELYQMHLYIPVEPAKLREYMNATQYISKDKLNLLNTIRVKSVDLQECLFTDTYCFNEPKHHIGYFNGILTGQSSD